MRILLAGPDHPRGSLPPYLTVLADHLRRHGVTVDLLGSTGVPYDTSAGRFHNAEQIIAAVTALAEQTDPTRYDLISLHFGNLEIEQLLPAHWLARHPAMPPIVTHVHALQPTLFTEHIPDESLHAAAIQALTSASGLIYFGSYAHAALTQRLPQTSHIPHALVVLPTTIPTGTRRAAGSRLAAALSGPWRETALLSLCGYAAPWKSPADLLAALEACTTPVRVVLAGPFWDDPRQAGADLRVAVDQPYRVGPAAELIVVPEYLDPVQRAALVYASAAGVFPYRTQPTFQGSGAIADYLAHDVPVLAADVANMAELTGRAGVLVPAGEPAALAAAIDRLAGDPEHLHRLRAAACAQAQQFAPGAHAAACLSFYRRIAR